MHLGLFLAQVREDPRVSEFELRGKRLELQNRGVDASEFLRWLPTTSSHRIGRNDPGRQARPPPPRDRLNDGSGLHLKLFVEGGSHGWRFD